MNLNNINQPEFKILIVDDDLIDRMILERWCKRNNLSYVSAKDGKEAIELLKTQSIQLVFSDLDMPVLSGFELIKSIRNDEAGSRQHKWVIAISGNEKMKVNQDFAQYGFDYYLPKPPMPDQLEKIVSTYLTTVRTKKPH